MKTKCKVAVACPQCKGVRRIDAHSARRLAREGKGGGRCRKCMGKAFRRPFKPEPRVSVVCPRCKKPREMGKYAAAKIARDGKSQPCKECAPILCRKPASDPNRPKCRHCTKGYVNRPRGLCWTCYYAPGVKELYPSTSKYAARGLGNLTSGAGLPMPEPTDAVPGTPEKVAVLIARAAAGQALFHPLDPMGDPRCVEWTPPRLPHPRSGGGSRHRRIFDTDELGVAA